MEETQTIHLDNFQHVPGHKTSSEKRGPGNREAFKQYCLRRLGAPVIQIDVADEQLEDRIDEAIQYYQDYHFDGTLHILYRHQVTAEDRVNKYITVPDTIIGVTNLFVLGGSYSVNNLFNVRYQVHLSDLYHLLQSSVVPYYMAMTHVNFLEEIFVGRQPFRFNRHTNKVFIDTSWEDKILTDSYIILNAYQVIDPDAHTDMWNDRWLLRYATQLFKKQWGENLKKFEGIQLPGGVTLNGREIYQEASAELETLEREMHNNFSLPSYDLIA